MNAIPNRRGLLLGAITVGAAASVAVIPAIAAAETPDPILGLVEAHKAAWARSSSLRRIAISQRRWRPGEPRTPRSMRS
jgi:hypothetical protein